MTGALASGISVLVIIARTLSGVLAVCILAGGTLGCPKNRFMNCEADLDCTAEDPAAKSDRPFCENLRCVECRTTADCGPAEACNRTTKECQSLR